MLHSHHKIDCEIDTRYEKYGSDHRRSLINQLVSSICWNIVVTNLTGVPLEIFLTLNGPLFDRFCLSYMIFKYSSFFHAALLMSFITVVKYLCVFVLKNPTGVDFNNWFKGLYQKARHLKKINNSNYLQMVKLIGTVFAKIDW